MCWLSIRTKKICPTQAELIHSSSLKICLNRKKKLLKCDFQLAVSIVDSICSGLVSAVVMWSYWAVSVCLWRGCLQSSVHLCSRERWIWAEVHGSNLVLILFHRTLWKGGILRPMYWARFPAEFLKHPFSLSRSSPCIVDTLLSSFPLTEPFPCRVPSLQPGVGDGAAWGEHQGLSSVAPGLDWATPGAVLGDLWVLLTPCVQQGEFPWAMSMATAFMSYSSSKQINLR